MRNEDELKFGRVQRRENEFKFKVIVLNFRNWIFDGLRYQRVCDFVPKVVFCGFLKVLVHDFFQ